MTSPDIKPEFEKEPSCEPTLSRKKFLELVLKRGAIAGAILAAPKVIDKFLVPPVHAMIYTGAADTGAEDTTMGGADTG